ncbi:regulator of cell cycle RGCC [Paramormyrops kingsleyae]|uniref:regulator of cell cycle RGCC n=1 Tax=Paramormyrops kingsleyae TaxID=1676925 RepID=UPI000CD646B0|nr:regulator of cell cycle RGCC-like [Paramormyrops kingsleyae]
MTSEICADLEAELGELLQEFQDVVEELRDSAPAAPNVYQEHLVRAKRRAGVSDGVSDSGIDSDQSREQSPGSSLNTSEEELSTAGMNVTQRAKLGDTSELQSFIDNLDKELAEM